MENTGSTIQTMGRVIQVLGIIGSIIMAILSFIAADNAYGNEENFLIGFGIGYLIVGIISSIILGIFIIGFGELVENSQKAVSYLSIIKDASTNPTNKNSENHKTESSPSSAIIEKLEDSTNNEVNSNTNTTKMWKCPKCGNTNFANSDECMNCHTKVKFKSN